MAMTHRGAGVAQRVHTPQVAGSIPAGATPPAEATPRSQEIAALKAEFPTASPHRRREIRRRFKAIRADARRDAYGPQGAIVADHAGSQAGVCYLVDSRTGSIRRVTRHKWGNKKERRRSKMAEAARAAKAAKVQAETDASVAVSETAT